MLSKRSWARGVIVVETTLANLVPKLQARNIRAILIPEGTDDETIKRSILPNRILVTDKVSRFEDDASSFEYSLISTKIKDPIVLAKRISDESIKNKLWSRHQSFILKLLEDGTSELKNLCD